MRFAASLVAGLTATLIAFSAHAGAKQDFTLSNDTGYDIASVYISAANDDKWGGDIMGQDILANGSGTEIVFDQGDSTCNWDLKATYTDGTDAIWHGLNLCEISKVTIHYDHGSDTTSADLQ